MSADLRTRYLGLDLAGPLVASASPLTGDLDSLRRLEDAGAAAAVLPSLFEERIEHDEMAVHDLHESFADAFPEARGFFPESSTYDMGPDGYLELVASARKALSVPVIASLNGTTPGGWVRYAKLMEEAGAHAIELNVYFVAADPAVTSAEVEANYLDLVAAVRRSVSVPLAVKVGPQFSSFANMAVRLVEAGAQGLVLFNRYLHPDVDLDSLEVKPSLVLSTPYEARLPLRWIAILRRRIAASLAATSGVHGWEEAAKLLLVGADAVMMTSALLRYGTGHMRTVLADLVRWLDEKEYESIAQMKGSLCQVNSPDPGAFERANYVKALASWTGSGRDTPAARRKGDEMTKVEDLMKPQVVTVHPEETVDRAFVRLQAAKIRHVPVVEHGTVVGMISDRDLLKSLGRRVNRRTSAAAIRDAESALYVMPRKVRHIMSRGVVTVEPEAPAARAALIMGKRKIGALPVIKGGALVGIITATDILLAYARSEEEAGVAEATA